MLKYYIGKQGLQNFHLITWKNDHQELARTPADPKEGLKHTNIRDKGIFLERIVDIGYRYFFGIVAV